MIEPKPLEVKKETLANDSIRVGVVLKEDNLKELTLTTHDSELKLGDSSVIPPNTEVTVSLVDGKLSFTWGDGNASFDESAVVSLIPTSDLGLDPSLTVNPIIAGRSFHWKKEVSAHFPGKFELTVKDGVIQLVNELPFEDYLACVVVSEMSSGTPKEFVKAQTIAARSWAKCFLNEKHPGEVFELCNDDDCQRYHGVTFADELSLASSKETAGEYLIDSEGRVVAAYYSKSCGGMTDSPLETFGFEVPGVGPVLDGESSVTPDDLEAWLSLTEETATGLYCAGPKEEIERILGGVDDAGEYFRWTHRETKEDLAKYLDEKSSVNDATKVIAFFPGRRGPSGRLHELTFVYETSEGEKKEYVSKTQYEIRSLLHPSFLYSSAIMISEESDAFVFKGAGWGHGVGLCQIGGTFQAIKGRSYQEILKLYFPETSLEKCY